MGYPAGALLAHCCACLAALALPMAAVDPLPCSRNTDECDTGLGEECAFSTRENAWLSLIHPHPVHIHSLRETGRFVRPAGVRAAYRKVQQNKMRLVEFAVVIR